MVSISCNSKFKNSILYQNIYIVFFIWILGDGSQTQSQSFLSYMSSKKYTRSRSKIKQKYAFYSRWSSSKSQLANFEFKLITVYFLVVSYTMWFSDWWLRRSWLVERNNRRSRSLWKCWIKLFKTKNTFFYLQKKDFCFFDLKEKRCCFFI